MRIGCVCPTYKRPVLLGRLIHCFLTQTCQDSYLVILDDANQYTTQYHERWCLISTPQRYPSLGEKRQAGVSMLPVDCEGYMVMDDDDVYFPHAIQNVADALTTAPWAQCRVVFETLTPDKLTKVEAFGKKEFSWGYGGCWAYRLAEFYALDGYAGVSFTNDDVDLAHKFYRRHGPSADSTPRRDPWYWYNRDPAAGKVAQEGATFWQQRGQWPHAFQGDPPIGWNGLNFHTLPQTREVQPRPF